MAQEKGRRNKMINIFPVEFPGIESILADSDYYKDKLIKDSVICFRNAHLTQDEQFDLAGRLGKLIGWSLLNDKSEYIENHVRKADIPSGPDDIIVEWHVEHTYYKNPIVASTWNMYNFKTDNNNGKTYFVDTGVVFEMLTEEEQQFLFNSVITEPDVIRESQLKNGFASANLSFADSYPIISPHWLTSKPIIRFTILPNHLMVKLVSYQGDSPTSEQSAYFEKLIRKIEKIIWTNEDIRMVHRWQQGDLVIPDMFKLAHAVTGGFSHEDREFRGIWGYRE